MKKSSILLILLSFLSGISFSQRPSLNALPEIEIVYKTVASSIHYEKLDQFEDAQQTNNYFKLWINPKKKQISYIEKDEKGKKLRSQKFEIHHWQENEEHYEFFVMEKGVAQMVVIWKKSKMLAIRNMDITYIYSENLEGK